MKKPIVELPERSTVRSEFVKRPYGYAGPYYYAYWRVGKKVKKKYLGNELPEELRSLYKAKDIKEDGSISSAMSALFDGEI